MEPDGACEGLALDGSPLTGQKANASARPWEGPIPDSLTPRSVHFAPKGSAFNINLSRRPRRDRTAGTAQRDAQRGDTQCWPRGPPCPLPTAAGTRAQGLRNGHWLGRRRSGGRHCDFRSAASSRSGHSAPLLLALGAPRSQDVDLAV